jgi:hypothetical protein
MIAASIVLYIGLGIIIAITVRSHWKAAHPRRQKCSRDVDLLDPSGQLVGELS